MNDTTNPGDMSARAVGYVEPVTLSSEEFEQIRPFFDDRASIEPKDLYGFRMIACSDGADAYYTRQHYSPDGGIDSSLHNYVADLKSGSSVLGSHLYETFSFGNSFDGEIVEADAGLRQYEPTFHRQLDLPEFRTTRWVIGKYYIPRNVELNGQPTNDLIRAMETGAVRRASITFTIGKYVCNIDDKDMLLGWDRMLADPDELECRHFPGVKYEGGYCIASMRGNQLLETSLVYRNASPSAMLIRKAEAMASRGLLKGSELVSLEERLGQRLPRPEPTAPLVTGWVTTQSASTNLSSSANWEPVVGGSEMPKLGDAQVDERPDDEQQPADESQEEPTTEGGDNEEERTVETDIIDTLAGSTSKVLDVLASSPSSLSTAELERLAKLETSLESALQAAGYEQTVGGNVTRQFEVRHQAIAEALGTDLTVEAVRHLKRDADMGTELFTELVRDAVAARISALGEHANPETYKAQLEASRDVSYVKAEIDAYRAIKSQRFTPHRQVQPRELPDRKAPKDAPKADQNILSPRNAKES